MLKDRQGVVFFEPERNAGRELFSFKATFVIMLCTMAAFGVLALFAQAQHVSTGFEWTINR